ncbi:unnamed protein product [Owenia fusiformis]|uniref:Uncharacterized protein n=1 Tax=Owenia fusiformis TaxID=6347 RepID=A0A8J1UT33_OWEFU|nr:unnamed protein product [Owenia fusiformis]
MQAESAILRQLQKSFKIVKHQYEKYNKDIEETRQYVESIVNLSEQLIAIKDVEMDSTPLEKFPDVKDKLSGKLMMSIEHLIEKLALSLHNQEMCVRHITQCQTSTSELCRQRYSAQLDIQAAMEGQPLRPSITDMLLWLQSIEVAVRLNYGERELAMNTVAYTSEDKMHILQDKWSIDKQLDNSMLEIMARLMYFLPEKL